MSNTAKYICDLCKKEHVEAPGLDGARFLVTLRLAKPDQTIGTRATLDFCDTKCLLNYLHHHDYIAKEGMALMSLQDAAKLNLSES